jgi:DNA sulfur modification protein DndB
MPEWESVKKGHLRAMELRQESICTHAVVVRGLGAAGKELLELDAEDWQDRLPGLLFIDWKKKNHDWENVCMIGTSIVSNKQARIAMRAYIKMFLELPLTDGETRALPEAFRLDLAKRIKELKDDIIS